MGKDNFNDTANLIKKAQEQLVEAMRTLKVASELLAHSKIKLIEGIKLTYFQEDFIEPIDKIKSFCDKITKTPLISNNQRNSLDELKAHFQTINQKIKKLKSIFKRLSTDDIELLGGQNFFKKLIKQLLLSQLVNSRKIHTISQAQWREFINKDLILFLIIDIPIFRLIRHYYNQTHTHSENLIFSTKRNQLIELKKLDFYESERNPFKGYKYNSSRYNYINL